MTLDRRQPPARWAVACALTLVYVSWGTTYLAIKKGVDAFPPGLFGGARIGLAGLVLLGYLAARGQPLGMPRRDFIWTVLSGVLLFVGGNGLIMYGEKISVASGVASVLVATTPLWMVGLELLWPWGERLDAGGWLGLFIGLAGVLLLFAPRLEDPRALLADVGPWLVLGSSFLWSFSSFLLRYRRIRASYLVVAAYQMAFGGAALFMAGVLLGEPAEFSTAHVTPAAVYAFFHLLVFGSLVGFVAYIWLLGHVSAAMAGTYAYVNPLIAVLAGWLLNDEPVTAWLLGGMVVILVGVTLVRRGEVRARAQHKPSALAEATRIDPLPKSATRRSTPGVSCHSGR
jgi:drug/metabolite transporter (DMT)-like permease